MPAITTDPDVAVALWMQLHDSAFPSGRMVHSLGLEQWLAGADPQATTDCAHTCSLGQADPVEVAAWVGTLAAHLHQRIDIRDAGADPWS